MKRFLAIFLPLLILCCALTMSASAESTATGATAPADIPDVGIKGASLSLKDNVYIYFMLSDSAATSGADDWGVIFYLTDPGESASYATATAEDSTAVVRHKESAYQWTNAATGKVYYSFNYGVYAKQMTDTIYGQGWCRIGDEYYCGNVQPYSVQTYAANKLGINNSTPVSNVTSSTELIDLLVSMLDYGARAQEYLNYNTDNLADSIITSGLSYWKISEAPGCVWVWDYTGTDTVVHIPGVVLEGEYKGCRVTRIGGAVFQDNQTMESITFPSTLERIDVDTFAGSKLWDDPNNWDSGENAYGGSVEKAAFYVNDWLVRLANRGEVATLTIREGTKHINAQNDDTFDGILALRSIHIPASVKTIGDNAFLGCTELASVTFAEDSQLESIGACAFSLLNTDQSKCNYALKSITIPASVKYIGDSAFYGCSGLESITFEPGSKLETIDNMAFGSLPDDYTPLEAITIPASVKTMGYSVFVDCRYLTKVTFEPGSKLESMDTDIFQNCAALKRVENWPAGMKTIPERTFECSGLEGFVIPDGVESIGVIAFGSCEQLETVVIPKSVKSIEELAFTDCTGLKTICYYGTEAEWNAITKDASWDEGAGTYTIIYNFDPTTMPMYKYTVIDEAAKTAKLTGLTMFNNGGALNIPEIIDGYTITVIGASAFEEDATITSVNIPSTVTEIEDFAFDSCTALGTVTFAEGSQLTTVGGRAFAVCTALKSIAVPAGVTEIGNSAFLDCTALETVTFAEDSKLTTLKYQTFFGCTALKSIAVPAGVTEIGNSAFLDCTALGTVTFAEGSQLKKLGYHTFYGCTVLKSIALPDGVTFEDDTFDVSAPCVEKVDGLYYIGRYLIDYDENSPKELTVRAGTKYIVNEAMAYYYQLKSITLPADIVSLGDKAFYDCYRLETIKYLGTQAQWDAITKGSNWDMYVGSYTADNKYTLITTATGLTYIDNGDGKTVTVSGIGTFTGTVLHIPSIVPDGEHAGKKVTAIGNNAFQGTSLTGVVIPEGVTTIGSNAFLNCESLQTVVLPEGVTSINEYAFEFCKKLTAINWPESLTYIGEQAFDYCEKLESIHIPKNVSEIHEKAFGRCLSLKSITVDPENTAYAVTDGYLYSIADGVLLTAVVGENMVVPANIKRIAEYAFQYNNTLKTVSFAEGTQIKSFGKYTFGSCTNLTSITLPEGFTEISERVFDCCRSLTNITIPASVTKIDYFAFSGCGKLANVTFAEGSKLKTIMTGAFNSCASLTDITIPLSVTQIGPSTFEYCSALKQVIIPASVTSIGEKAFFQCWLLENIYFLGTQAQWDTINRGIDWDLYAGKNIHTGYILTFAATGLKYTDNGDGTATVSGIGTFKDSTTLVIPAIVPDGEHAGKKVTAIGNDAFATTLIKKVVIPDSVTTIGARAFKDCQSLQTVVLPGGLTTLDLGVFQQCKQLTAINWPASLTHIADGAFEYCENLESIHLPKGLTRIEESAFSGCLSLKSITVDPENTAYAVTDGYLYSIADGVLLTAVVGENMVVPANIKRIGAYVFQGNNTLKTVSFAEGSQLESIGDDVFKRCNNLKSITLPEGISKIGDDAFRYCTSLTEITIPASVTEISRYAFDGCSKLADVNFAEGSQLKKIGGSRVFGNCTSLTEFTIPDGITSIKNGMFDGCSALKWVIIPASVTSIEMQAFCNCTSLENIYFLGTQAQWNAITLGNDWDKDTGSYKVRFPGLGLRYEPDTGYRNAVRVHSIGSCTDTELVIAPISLDGGFKGSKVTAIRDAALSGEALTEVTILPGIMRIGRQAFSNSKLLTEVTILDSATSIGEKAFSDCTSLTKINLPDGLMSISAGMVEGCTALREIVIPASVTSIGENAFEGCTSLTTIYFLGTEAQWNAITKGQNWDQDTGSSLGGYKVCFTSSGLEYTLNSDGETVTVSGIGSCTDTELTIPNIVPDGQYKGKKVTAIKDRAFEGNTSITSVTVLDRGVTTIGEYAFYNCTALTQVILPDSVTSMGKYVFSGCTGLKDVKFGSGLTAIAEYAFSGSGITGIILADATNYGANVFYAGKDMTSVIVLPTGLKTIEEGAFSDCRRLEIVILPFGSITGIGDSAFSDCTGLETMAFLGTQAQWNNTTKGNNWDKNAGTATAAKTYTFICVPDGLTFTKYGAYMANVTGLSGFTGTTLFIPTIVPDGELAGNSVAGISADALKDQTTIKTVILPGRALLRIRSGAFANCTALESINIPATVNNIEADAFAGCSKLVNITVDAANYHFAVENGCLYKKSSNELIIGAPGLKSITVPSNITSIGSKAFYQNKVLESIIIPTGVTTIGANAFEGCTSLKSIYYCGTEAQWNAITKDSDWDKNTGSYKVCFPSLGLSYSANSDGTATVSGIGSCKDTDLVIFPIVPDGQHMGKKVTAIKKGAFKGNTSITSVVIPDSVTSMGENNASTNAGAFSGCTSLKEVKLGSGLTIIEPYTFINTAITSITIPGNITTIGYQAFQNSSKLETVIISDGVEIIGQQAFLGCSELTTVYIPASVKEMKPTVFYECSKLNTIYYYGTEAEWNAIPKGYSWDEKAGSYKVYFPGLGLSYNENSDGTVTVSGIGSCTDTDLFISAIVPDGQYKGKKVTAIKKGAFKGNTSITSVVIPDSVTSMGENNANTNLGAFSDCTSLKEVKLGSGLTTIEPYTFTNTAITSITIPGNITTIGYKAFQDSSKLETVIISDGLESIGAYVFVNCTKVTVVMPTSVRSIRSNAFDNSMTVNYCGTEAQWKAIDGYKNVTCNVVYEYAKQ